MDMEEKNNEEAHNKQVNTRTKQNDGLFLRKAFGPILRCSGNANGKNGIAHRCNRGAEAKGKLTSGRPANGRYWIK